MTWTASLHGDVEALGEDAERAERAVADALRSIVEGLVPAGHTGVGATFHGSTTGDINLIAPGEPVDAGPSVGTTPDPVAALGTGEVSAADVAAAAGVEPGTPVPLAPGQALAPEPADTAPEAAGDAQQGLDGSESADTAVEPPPAS